MTAAFQRLKLPEEKLASITRFTASYGSSWVDREIDRVKAELWITKNLIKNPEKSIQHSRMCYASGKNFWRRIDGTKITEDDLAALRSYTIGQGNRIVLQECGMEVLQEWFIDSSD